MKTSISLLITLAIAATLGAQSTHTLKHQLQLEYNLQLGSSNISNQMLYKLGLGGYISPQVIDKNYEHIGNTLTAGSSGIINLNYQLTNLKPDTVKLLFQGVSLYMASQQSLLASKDLFGLIFKGNSAFLGRNLILDNSQLQNWNYYTLNTHFLLPQKNKTKQFKITHASAGLALINNYQKVKITNGQLYTDTNANFIKAKINASATASNYNIITGLGPSFGIIGRINNQTTFQLQNLGFAYMFNTNNRQSNSEPQEVQINQVQINSTQLNNTDWAKKQADTVLETLLPPSVSRNPVALLPFQIAINQQITKRWQAAVNYLAMRAYIPQASLKYAFVYKSNSAVSAIIQLGGFDTYNLGLEYKFISRTQSLQLQIAGLEALAFPTKTHGLGAVAQYSYRF